MKFLIVDKIRNTELVSNNYPRGNRKIDKPLEGKNSENIQIYIIIDEPITFNTEMGYLEKTNIEKTSDKYNNIPHLLIAIQHQEYKRHSENVIIDNLYEKLGNYLDKNYPLSLRDKHSRMVFFNKVDGSELQYVKDLDNWLDECRNYIETIKSDYLSDPDNYEIELNFPLKPIKK